MSDNNITTLKDIATSAANSEIEIIRTSSERINLREDVNMPSDLLTTIGPLNDTPATGPIIVSEPQLDTAKSNNVQAGMVSPVPMETVLNENPEIYKAMAAQRADMLNIDTSIGATTEEAPKPVEVSQSTATQSFESLLSRINSEDDAWKSLMRVKYFDNYEAYYKKLIVDDGIDPDSAIRATYNRYAKILQDIITEESNDVAVEVIINKAQDVNTLGLTPDEHKKIEKVNRMRLIAIEDKDLNTIKIERPNEEFKADYISSIERSISKHNQPLPLFGDFVSFKGAQIVQMANAINYEGSTAEEIFTKKASLIYDKLLSGAIFKKFDETGKNILPYTEFINKFPFQDIDIALYAIICASSMEESMASLTCNSCEHTWMQKYNMNALLKLEGLSDSFKERIDMILSNRSNKSELIKLHEDMKKVRRYKSPFSNNIYDISYPSIARALNILGAVGTEDIDGAYLSGVGIYISSLYVYNEKTDAYVEVLAEETNILINTLRDLSSEDIDLLTNQIREELYYELSFMMDIQCPSCKKESKLPLELERLVFLKAQDSTQEISR